MSCSGTVAQALNNLTEMATSNEGNLANAAPYGAALTTAMFSAGNLSAACVDQIRTALTTTKLKLNASGETLSDAFAGASANTAPKAARSAAYSLTFLNNFGESWAPSVGTAAANPSWRPFNQAMDYVEATGGWATAGALANAASGEAATIAGSDWCQGSAISDAASANLGIYTKMARGVEFCRAAGKGASKLQAPATSADACKIVRGATAGYSSDGSKLANWVGDDCRPSLFGSMYTEAGIGSVGHGTVTTGLQFQDPSSSKTFKTSAWNRVTGNACSKVVSGDCSELTSAYETMVTSASDAVTNKWVAIAATVVGLVLFVSAMAYVIRRVA